MTPRAGTIGDYADSVRLVNVDETKLEAFWNALMIKYHYMGDGKKYLSYIVVLSTFIISDWQRTFQFFNDMVVATLLGCGRSPLWYI